MAGATRVVLAAVFVLVLAARLCHVNILWVEEAYGLAAAREMLAGKLLYQDIWFDKPPLYAVFYALFEAAPGMPLRIAGACFVIASALMLYRFARAAWGEAEGRLAAILLCFFLTFGIPGSVMALAPDLLLVIPHAAAVYLAWRGLPLASGLLAGLGLLVNAKALFVIAACLLWQWRSAPLLLSGALLVNVPVLLVPEYREQVWRWGLLYSSDTFLSDPIRSGLLRTVNWAGFHLAAVIPAGLCLWRERSWRMTAWLIVSLAGVVAGWRFFPRYYFMLLVPVTLLAARGLMLVSPKRRVALLGLLLIPGIRFGPRYGELAADLIQGRAHRWADLAMNDDSRKAAGIVRSVAKPGDTLLVWGYRPDVWVYSGLLAGTPYLDSQPLTGVLADRHLGASAPSAPGLAAANRRGLLRSTPSFIVDGLGPVNPALSIENYPEIAAWLSRYRIAGRTRMSTVYALR